MCLKEGGTASGDEGPGKDSPLTKAEKSGPDASFARNEPKPAWGAD